MRSLLLVLCLLLSALVFAQPTITNAEYYIGTDPGEGLGTPITVSSPSGNVNLAWTVPTGSLTPDLYRVNVRVRTNAGLWSRPTAQYLAINPGNQVGQLITQFDWAVDGGTPTVVDVTDAASVNISQLVPTTGLSLGLHRVNIRTYDNVSRVAQPVANYIIINTGATVTRLVTQFEYSVDGGAPISVDVADAAQVNIAQTIATGSLTPGTLHRVNFRVTDDLGRVAQFTSNYLAIDAVPHASRNITTYEYWVDSDPPTLVDNADAPLVNISEMIPTNIPVGLHYINFRTSDNQGHIGQAHRVAFVVMSPFQNSVPRNLTAAEVWINADPGPGNAIALPLPDDGVWDESSEQADTIFTNIPGGRHIIGFRFRDNTGRWSQSEIDSLEVGPILVIRPAASNSVILDWSTIPGATSYNVKRATTIGGTYNTIASPVTNTYTDAALVDLKNYYRVTAITPGLSPYRLPESRPLRD